MKLMLKDKNCKPVNEITFETLIGTCWRNLDQPKKQSYLSEPRYKTYQVVFIKIGQFYALFDDENGVIEPKDCFGSFDDLVKELSNNNWSQVFRLSY